MANISIDDELTKLNLAIVERHAKIEDVKERIERQKDHIDKTRRKKERFEEHLARWERQNKRDLKRIKELKGDTSENKIPVQILDVQHIDNGATIIGTAEGLEGFTKSGKVDSFSIVEDKNDPDNL